MKSDILLNEHALSKQKGEVGMPKIPVDVRLLQTLARKTIYTNAADGSWQCAACGGFLALHVDKSQFRHGPDCPARELQELLVAYGISI